MKNTNSKKSNIHIFFRIASIFLLVFLVFLAMIYFYISHNLNKMDSVKLSETHEELYVEKYIPESKPLVDERTENSKVEKKAPDVRNIVLIGVDAKNPDGSQRSDSVMIVSIDFDHKDIKLTSILRDTYVEMPGVGYSRMGHSFQDGGPSLVIKTINKNFKLDITDFVKVDFQGFRNIVDALGGVEIQIKENDIDARVRSAGISKPGTYNLNGNQALAYSRNRFTQMGDYGRTDRQRLVITKIFKKMKSKGSGVFAATLPKLLPFIQTSLNSKDIMELGTKILTSGVDDVKQARLPFEGHRKEKYINGDIYVTYDERDTVDLLHGFIYEDLMP